MTSTIEKLLIIDQLKYIDDAFKDILKIITYLYIKQYKFIHYKQGHEYDNYADTILESISQDNIPIILSIFNYFDKHTSLYSIKYDEKQYRPRETLVAHVAGERNDYDPNIICDSEDDCKAPSTIFPESIDDVGYGIKLTDYLSIDGKLYKNINELNNIILIGYKNIIIENKINEFNVPHSLTNHCAIHLQHIKMIIKENKYVNFAELLTAHYNLKRCKFHNICEKLTKCGYENIMIDGDECLKINLYYEYVPV